MSDPSPDEVDDFVRHNDIDDRAAADLRNCSGDIQRKVLARGELSTARNPSAAVLARIRDARVTGGSTCLEVEDFIKNNDVDDSAAGMLRSSSPTVQRSVLCRGELKTARNPSSALLSRIRDAKVGFSGGGAPCGGNFEGGVPPPPAGMPPMMMQMGSYPGYPYGMGYQGYPGYPGYSSCGQSGPQPDSRGYAYPSYPSQVATPHGAHAHHGAYGAYGYYGMAGYGASQQQVGNPVLPLQEGVVQQDCGRSRSRSRSRRRGRSRGRGRSRARGKSRPSSYSSSPSRKTRRRRRSKKK